MWGSTAQMAYAVVEGLAAAGIEAQLYAVPQEDLTTVVGALLEAKGLIVGSPTHNRRMLMNIAALLEDLAGLRPVKKLGAALGSHGWGGGAVPLMEKALQEAGIEVAQPGLALAWRPAPAELEQAVAFGRAFGGKLWEALGGQDGPGRRPSGGPANP
jgi:flavorubredoxin